MTEKITIGLQYDGWEIILPNEKRFSWNHNEEDNGTLALQALLEELGFETEIEEQC